MELCVIPGTVFDVSPWVRRTGAHCLAEGFAVEPQEIVELLDRMASFDGLNGFLQAGGKGYAIRTLRVDNQQAD